MSEPQNQAPVETEDGTFQPGTDDPGELKQVGDYKARPIEGEGSEEKAPGATGESPREAPRSEEPTPEEREEAAALKEIGWGSLQRLARKLPELIGWRPVGWLWGDEKFGGLVERNLPRLRWWVGLLVGSALMGTQVLMAWVNTPRGRQEPPAEEKTSG